MTDRPRTRNGKAAARARHMDTWRSYLWAAQRRVLVEVIVANNSLALFSLSLSPPPLRTTGQVCLASCSQERIHGDLYCRFSRHSVLGPQSHCRGSHCCRLPAPALPRRRRAYVRMCPPTDELLVLSSISMRPCTFRMNPTHKSHTPVQRTRFPLPSGSHSSSLACRAAAGCPRHLYRGAEERSCVPAAF